MKNEKKKEEKSKTQKFITQTMNGFNLSAKSDKSKINILMYFVNK